MLQKKNLWGKTYIPVHSETETSYRGNPIVFDGSKEYLVTNVKFTKFLYDYGFLVEFNNLGGSYVFDDSTKSKS